MFTTRPFVISAGLVLVCVGMLVALQRVALLPASLAGSRVILAPCHVDGVQQEVRCGVYNVLENRRTPKGRTLPLKIVLIPARQSHPDQGPIFFLTGGPGETATEMTPYIVAWGEHAEHDVVLVDERGTGDGHRLDCPPVGSDASLEGYFTAPFDPDAARACQRELSRRYDLRQYTTAAFVEDLDEVRQALGYTRINLSGGSFGTYAALIYIRRYGEHVRSAYLTSLVTLSNRVPLYHAQSAQWALDQLFDQCDRDAACHAAYPQLRNDFATILAAVRAKPILTWVPHPVTGTKTEIHLSERAFADGVRVMMYSADTARQLPFLIQQAKSGDFSPFADAALRASRGIYTGLRVGLNYAITCSEFVARIRPDEVDALTKPTYLGSWRVDRQMAACREWPTTELPADYFQPFRSDVPAVLVSGDADPASPPHWAEEVMSFMPNAVHTIVPGGGHTPDNDCTRSIRAALFRTGTTRNLDLGCATSLRPPSFKIGPIRVSLRPAA